MERAPYVSPLKSRRSPLLLLGAGAVISATAGFAASARQPGTVTRYVCADTREFSVYRSDRAAAVHTVRAVYRLPRRSSSIGERFASPSATLIVDGDFAAFVAGDEDRFRNCRVATPSA